LQFQLQYGGAKSLVYIKYPGVTLEFINTSFHDNQGASIYVLNSGNLHINRQALFENNIAENVAEIYISDNSTIIFGKNSNVKFINNCFSQWCCHFYKGSFHCFI